MDTLHTTLHTHRAACLMAIGVISCPNLEPQRREGGGVINQARRGFFSWPRVPKSGVSNLFSYDSFFANFPLCMYAHVCNAKVGPYAHKTHEFEVAFVPLCCNCATFIVSWRVCLCAAVRVGPLNKDNELLLLLWGPPPPNGGMEHKKNSSSSRSNRKWVEREDVALANSTSIRTRTRRRGEGELAGFERYRVV